MKISFLLLFLLHSTVTAAPMGFADSTMVMTEASQGWKEVSANYAITNKDAVGVAAIITPGRSDQLLTYTRLAKRWNAAASQTNLWLFGGVGSMNMAGMQFDHETTRIYSAATWKAYRALGVNNDTASLRTGFSFYEVDYDETQPWLIVEAKKIHGTPLEVTPMLRLIHNRFFVEAGYSNQKQLRFNLMLNF